MASSALIIRNPNKNLSTYLIHSKTTTSEENDCMLQNTDFLCFYLTNSLLHQLLSTPSPSLYPLFLSFISSCYTYYKSSLGSLSSTVCFYLNQLIEREAEVISEQDEGSEGRFSDEIKYEMKMIVEAEKSVDEEDKKFFEHKQQIMKEYESVIERINRGEEISEVIEGVSEELKMGVKEVQE
jgi:hypothetical protein